MSTSRRVADGLEPERCGAADGELELVGVGVLRLGDAEDDGHARAARLLVLAHHQLAGLGGRLPVDLTTRVAGRVLADRVERHVGVDESPRRVALEVADEAGARRRQRDGARMHVELVHVLERVLAAQEADRVAAHRRWRADGDDAAPQRRDLEGLRDGCARGAAAARRIRRARRRRGCRCVRAARSGARGCAPTISPVTPSPATTRSWASDEVDVVGARAEQERACSASSSDARPRRRPSTPPSRTRCRRRAPPSRRAATSTPAGRTVRRLQPPRRRPRRARTRHAPRPPHDRANEPAPAAAPR